MEFFFYTQMLEVLEYDNVPKKGNSIGRIIIINMTVSIGPMLLVLGR